MAKSNAKQENAKTEAPKAEAVKGGLTVVRKLTVKTVLGSAIPKPEKETRLITIIGQISSHEPKQTDFGISQRFKGNFKAIRVSDGHEFIAGQAFFPGVVEDLIVGSMPEEGTLDVAFHIGIRPANTDRGYEYTMEPVLKQQSNPLAHLEVLLLEAK